MGTHRNGKGSNQYQTRPGGLVTSRSAPRHARLRDAVGQTDAGVLTLLLNSDDARTELTKAWRDGTLRRLVPELDALARLGTGVDGIHHKDQLAHTFQVVAQCPPGNLRVRLAALFHDIAKPQTRKVIDGEVTFRYHEQVGAKIAENRLTALGFADPLPAQVRLMVELSGHHKNSDEWEDSATRRFVAAAGEVLPDLLALYRADCTTRHDWKRQEVQDQVDRLEKKIAGVVALDQERARRPVIDGNAVMKRYGLPPGPEVGRLLKSLLAYQRDHGDDLSDEDAWAYLDQLRG